MHQSVIKVTRWNLKVISLRILLQRSSNMTPNVDVTPVMIQINGRTIENFVQFFS